MNDMMITVRTAKEQPKYKKTAAALLERCRVFYQDPENERAYQEWKEKRNDTSQLIQRNRRTGSVSGDGGIQNRRAVRMGGVSDKGTGKALAGRSAMERHQNTNKGKFL